MHVLLYMHVIHVPVISVQFSSSFAIVMVFPYLPFMMEFLIPRLKDDHQAVGKPCTLYPVLMLCMTTGKLFYLCSACRIITVAKSLAI